MGRCFQFGRQRLAVGAEDPAHVGGVLLAGVEVDVVGHLERQVHRHRRQRQQVRFDRVAVGGVAEHARRATGGPRPRRAGRASRKSFRLGWVQLVPDSMPACSAATPASSTWSPIADADPAQVRVVGGEHAVRQRGQAEGVVRGQVEPAGAHAVSLIRPSVDRSCDGVRDPAAAVRREEGADDAGVGRAHAGEDVQQWRRVPLLQQGRQLGHLCGVGQRPAGGAEDVEEPVLALALGGGVRDGAVQATGELEPQLHVDAGAQERGQLGRVRDRQRVGGARAHLGLQRAPAGRVVPDVLQRGDEVGPARHLHGHGQAPAQRPGPLAGPRDLGAHHGQRGVAAELVEGPLHHVEGGARPGHERDVQRRGPGDGQQLGGRGGGHEERADQVGPRLRPAGQVLLHGAGQGSQARREDRGVVDQAAEERPFGRVRRARGGRVLRRH